MLTDETVVPIKRPKKTMTADRDRRALQVLGKMLVGEQPLGLDEQLSAREVARGLRRILEVPEDRGPKGWIRRRWEALLDRLTDAMRDRIEEKVREMKGRL